jgi:hypothetical protein
MARVRVILVLAAVAIILSSCETADSSPAPWPASPAPVAAPEDMTTADTIAPQPPVSTVDANTANASETTVPDLPTGTAANGSLTDLVAGLPENTIILDDADSEAVAAVSAVAAMYGSFGPSFALGSHHADGSGCTPGTEGLPDGIWYGRVVAKHEQVVVFDLMCRYSNNAYQAIHTPHDVAFDMSTTNTSTFLRSVPIGEDAHWFVPVDGGLTRLAIPAATDATTLLDAARPGWLLIENAMMVEFFAEPNVD